MPFDTGAALSIPLRGGSESVLSAEERLDPEHGPDETKSPARAL